MKTLTLVSPSLLSPADLEMRAIRRLSASKVPPTRAVSLTGACCGRLASRGSHADPTIHAGKSAEPAAGIESNPR